LERHRLLRLLSAMQLAAAVGPVLMWHTATLPVLGRML
jgi:hypothetical protein